MVHKPIVNHIGVAGNKGPGVRSDCLITVELTDNGGYDIQLNSKVGALFSDSIIALAKEMLASFGLVDVKLTIEDSGALPFVLAARIEAAIKQVIDTDQEYWPDLIPQNWYHTRSDRYRRSRLYLPGNTPKLMLNAGVHKPDGIILDFEDSVAPVKKDEARLLVRNALRQVDFYGAERMVRINQLPRGLDDLDYIVPHNVNLVLIPKVETAEQVVASGCPDPGNRRGAGQ